VGLTIDVAVILQNKCELTLKRNSIKPSDGLSGGGRERERESERERGGDIKLRHCENVTTPTSYHALGMRCCWYPSCSVLSTDVYVPVISVINFFVHIPVTAFLVHVTHIFYCSNESAVESQHCVVSAQCNRHTDRAVPTVNIEYH
jgi:hypothetical protein